MQLFIGLSLPDRVSSQLACLRGSLPHIQWRDPDTYHLTLNFIGEIRHYDLMNELDLRLEKIRCPAFELTIETVSYFQSSTQVQNFWAGVQFSEPLIHLHKKLEQCLRSLNINHTRQKFTPHITLATGTALPHSQIALWLAQYNLLKIPRVEIDYFSLFSIYPNTGHPFYRSESDYPLIRNVPFHPSTSD